MDIKSKIEIVLTTDEKEISITSETSFEVDENARENVIEAVRKYSNAEIIDNSWDQTLYASLNQSREDQCETPPFAAMVLDLSPVRSNSSTQTDPNSQVVTAEPFRSKLDVSLSFTTGFNLQDSTSNENSDHSLGNKCFRSTSYELKESRPHKKTKRALNLSTEPTEQRSPRPSSSSLSSTPESPFKSIKSNHTYKVCQRRAQSDPMIRNALQRSQRNMNHSENDSPGARRRAQQGRSWRIMDLCSWIGWKGYQSITGLYSDLLRERDNPDTSKSLDLNAMRRPENDLAEEVKVMKQVLQDVNNRQSRLERENDELKEQLKKMMHRIEDLESNRHDRAKPPSPCGPPPPPPPPPLPPLPGIKVVRSNTIPRCGSGPPGMHWPRFSITPQDIANVKLRNAKECLASRSKRASDHQPLVTQAMLRTTRANLSRARPSGGSSPKQQMSDLEKCLLQEPSVATLFRRRIARTSLKSAEELRVRPYTPAKGPRSPRSPRSNSLLRRTPKSPLKFPTSPLSTDQLKI